MHFCESNEMHFVKSEREYKVCCDACGVTSLWEKSKVLAMNKLEEYLLQKFY